MSPNSSDEEGSTPTAHSNLKWNKHKFYAQESESFPLKGLNSSVIPIIPHYPLTKVHMVERGFRNQAQI